MKKRLLAALALILSCVCGHAQEQRYDGSVSRGAYAPVFGKRFNGTMYWDNQGFCRGDVFFDGRLYKDVLLNVDAREQQLQVTSKVGLRAVNPNRDLVAWFTRGGVRYVNLAYYGVKDCPEGYYVLCSDNRGKQYFKQVRKVWYVEAGDHNGVSSIGYDDEHYDLRNPGYFRIAVAYYTVDENLVASKVRMSRARASRLTTVSEGPAFAETGVYAQELGILNGSPRFRQFNGLPAGYFAQENFADTHRDLMEYMEQSRMIAEIRNKTYVIGNESGNPATKAVVSGIVRDVATGEALSGVLVTDATGNIYSYTDRDGAYSLAMPLGDNVLKLSDYSKEDMHINVIVKSSGTLDLVMRDEVQQLQSAYVTSDGRAQHRTTSMGMEKFSIKAIGKIPTAFGEGDIIRAVMTLPGVKTVGEASSGFNVRGGSADQNLILFNEGTIYNPSHMFGIFSAFNPDVVESVELYKSSIPARYGGRISSVLDVRGKEGDSKRVRGSIGIGVLTSHAEVEGPLGSDRTTFVLGGRTTYSNWILGLLPANSGYAGGRANFYDINASVSHHFDKRNTLQAFAYWSHDNFGFSNDTTFRYSNLNVALRYTRKGDEGRQMTVAAGYDQYNNNLYDGVKAATPTSYILKTAVRQGFARFNALLPIGQHKITYGGEALYYALSPGEQFPGDAVNSIVLEKRLPLQQAVQPSVYAGDEWAIGDSDFSVDYGLRVASFMSVAPFSFYADPEVRLSGKYTPMPNLSVKAGVNTMSQYIHLISNTAGISPMDTWQLSNDMIKPQRGWQAAAGAYYTTGRHNIELSLEAYYKNVYNYLDYKSGAQLQMNPNLADDLVRTTCRAYGVELMVKKPSGKLTGWISYTYSRSLLKEAEDRGVSTINGGAWYPSSHDKPHDINVVGNYAFTHRYSLSVNLDYSTGRPVTLPVGQYYYEGALRLAYSQRNAYRIPDYFRMDLAFNIDAGHYLKALAHATFTIGCYNVTARKNAYSVYYTTNGGLKLQGYMLSVFATPVPYMTLNIKF